MLAAASSIGAAAALAGVAFNGPLWAQAVLSAARLDEGVPAREGPTLPRVQATAPHDPAAVPRDPAIGPPEPAAAAASQRLPDLRIVGLRVEPDPVPDGEAATVTMLLHNRSTIAATGSIVVALFHDGRPPLPVPVSRQLIRLGGDELREVDFRVAAARLADAPTFLYAFVDRDNAISEDDEANNVAVGSLRLCESPGAAEVDDGIDNDCDGVVDGGDDARRRAAPPSPGAAAPSSAVVFAQARPRYPYQTAMTVRLRTAVAGTYVTAEQGGGGELRADRAVADLWETFTLLDQDGGGLEHGDLVALRGHDGVHLVVAEGAGGGALSARGPRPDITSLFTLLREDGDGAVQSGDPIGLRAASGHWVVAEEGGGSNLRADREERGPWETFIIEVVGPAPSSCAHCSRQRTLHLHTPGGARPEHAGPEDEGA